MTFRGCRYEVSFWVPNRSLWSRHWSIKEARKSFREAVNNQRGVHTVGEIVELRDVEANVILEKATVRS